MANEQAKQLLQDPSFWNRGQDQQINALKSVDPDFSSFTPKDQTELLSKARDKFAPKESVYKTAAKVGLRGGLSEAEKTAGNLVSMIPGTGTKGAEIKKHAASYAPTPQEEQYVAQSGFIPQVVEGLSSAPGQILKSAPALASKKYAPLVAGAIGALSKADEGGWEAATQGAKDALMFYAGGKAGSFKTRAARSIGTGALMGAAAAAETGFDPEKTASAAVTGAVLGSVGGKQSSPAKQWEKAGKLTESIKTLVAPTALGPNAKTTGNIVAHRAAQAFNNYVKAEYGLHDVRGLMDKWRPEPTNPGGISPEAINFIDSIQTGDINRLPADQQTAARSIRKLHNENLREIQKYGLLQDFVENYYGVIWNKEGEASNMYQAIGKKPLEGGKGFLKQRVFGSFKDAVDYAKANPDKGLAPVSNNPIDIALLKHREAAKFITAKRVLDDMKGEGMLKLVRENIGEKPPTDYVKIADPVSKVIKDNRVVGNWYAPKDAAAVINNYLSPGLRGNAIFKTYTDAANALNQFQLGWSAFHAGFTTVDAATSQVALGIEQAVQGARDRSLKRMGEGLISASKAPLTPFDPVRVFTKSKPLAWKVLKEIENPGAYPEVRNMKLGGGNYDLIDLMEKGGFRAHQDPIYRLDMDRRIRLSMQHATSSLDILLNRTPNTQGMSKADAAKSLAKSGVSLAGQYPAKLTEESMKWLFESLVPMQKVGAWQRLMEFELSRMPQDMPPQEALRWQRDKAFKVTRSIDNRLGQLTYDNLFLNKTVKDLLHASTRSVGWNIGTASELGGGAFDTLKAIGQAAQGDPWEFTHKMAYIPAMIATVGLTGGIMNYLHTGKIPETTMDYFHPQSGRLQEDGLPERVSLPSYMKDVEAVTPGSGETTGEYFKRFGKTVAGKAQPMIGLAADVISNEDWKKTQLYNPQDPMLKQITDVAEFVAADLLPFSTRYSLQDAFRTTKAGGSHERQYSALQGAEALIGITPAPRSLTESATDRFLARTFKGLPQASRTKEKAQVQERLAEIEKLLRSGKPEEAEAQIATAQGEGATDRQLQIRKERSQFPPRVNRFKYLKPEEAVDGLMVVLRDPEVTLQERVLIHDVVVEKLLKNPQLYTTTDTDNVRQVAEKEGLRNKIKVLNMMDEKGEIRSEAPPQ